MKFNLKGVSLLFEYSKSRYSFRLIDIESVKLLIYKTNFFESPVFAPDATVYGFNSEVWQIFFH